jgi:probable HAF family extracellular repeat protein
MLSACEISQLPKNSVRIGRALKSSLGYQGGHTDTSLRRTFRILYLLEFKEETAMIKFTPGATASLKRISLLTLLPFMSAAAMAAQKYELVDLGVLAGQPDSIALGINAAGTVVGRSGSRAFISHGCGMSDLGLLSGGSSAVANAIDNQGIIAGSAVGADGASHAVSWHSGSIHLLQAGTAYQSQGLALDATGKVVGYEYGGGAAYATAYVNDQAVSVPSDDDSIYGWGPVEVVTGANGSGQLTGYRPIYNGQNQFITQLALVMPAGSNSWVRVTPPAGYATYSYAWAVNEDGAVAGWSSGSTEAAGNHAFLSTNPGAYAQNLGTLGGATSQAFALNNARWVVGVADTATSSVAFLYDGTEMIDLNTTLVNGGGWTLIRATGINDYNQIAAVGSHNGAQHAVLLRPVATSIGIGIISPCSVGLEPTVFASP